MNWPQVVVIVLLSLKTLGALMSIGNDEDPKEIGQGVLRLLAAALMAWLLYMGGFWTGGAR